MTLYKSWFRRYNLSTGDFNNDLTFSDTTGDIWSCPFIGGSIVGIAPKETVAGKIEIDGKSSETIDPSVQGMRQSQQLVFKVNGLAPGEHIINIVNRGAGPVLDAIVVQ